MLAVCHFVIWDIFCLDALAERRYYIILSCILLTETRIGRTTCSIIVVCSKRINGEGW